MENIKTKSGVALYLKKILIGVGIVFISTLYVLHWRNCFLNDNFFFSSLNLKLQIIFDIRSNQSALPYVARIFHNKLTQGSVDIFNAYISFWDIRFLLFLISPIAMLGIFLRIFYLIKEKIALYRFEKIFLFLILLTPFILLLHLLKNQFVGLLIFSILLIIFSIRGIFLFSKKQKYAWIFIVAALLFSLWFLMTISTGITLFCQK